MTRTIKSIILGIFLFLTLIMLTPTQVYADGWEDGTGGIGGDVSDDQNIGGVTKYRTGWILTLTGSDGLPILGSKVVFFPYLDNLPVGCSGTIATEFFNLPINDFEISKMINNLADYVDAETLISQLSFIKDASEIIELKKKEDEAKPKSPYDLAFENNQIGDANNDNQAQENVGESMENNKDIVDDTLEN